ncbi:WD40 region of ge1, enhancer of mRNA-decapping protein domain-containing protein [Phthorimaea operculella]|nr:WD40 region of ge1, enhancer of mRNA-decapping protein domain-containing protein [Phthorimaea operculella]
MTTHLMTTWRVCCSPHIVTSSETAAVLERDRCCVRARQVVWCPYIPDDDDAPDDDVARLLLTTHCNIARMWNISSIVKCISSTECRGDASSLLASAGALATSEHSAPIVDAAFSPDGTALATASHDGYVMFFQKQYNAAEHSAPIVDAAFSPDGTALATASHDGYVMFFQV